MDERYHFRKFTSGPGDTHSPGFRYYSLAPVHWEEYWHPESTVDPQRGQDEILTDLSGNPSIDHKYLKLVPKTNTECVSCDQWGGWVDIYQIWYIWGQNPCPNGPNYTIYGGTVITIRWAC